jgi:hypothetical protein
MASTVGSNKSICASNLELDKMNKDQSGIKKNIFILVMNHNLQLIIDFHNLQHQMMKNQISIINENIKFSNDKVEKKNLLIQKDNYVNTYDDLLNINTFLLMYAQLEEFLLLIKNSFDNRQIISNSGSIMRFNAVLKNTLKFNCSEDREWEILCDFEKIRDCILHSNSRVSLMKEKKKEEIERIVRNSKDKLSIKADRIKLSGEFLLIVSETIESVVKRIDKINSQH